MRITTEAVILLILALIFNGLVLLSGCIQRLFVVSLNPFGGALALLAFIAIAIPLVIIGGRRLARYYRGRFQWAPAKLCVLGFFTFLIGDCLNRLFFGVSIIVTQIRDTYFAMAYTHATIMLAILFLVFSAIYAWYPKVTGRRLNSTMGYIHITITLVIALIAIWPEQHMGMAGMPRRYMDFEKTSISQRYTYLPFLETRTLFLLVAAQLLFIVNLIVSLFWGPRKATAITTA